MKVRVTNIQRFCLHDGPGIRTTVFLKGCNLQCPWCANPENIIYEKQNYKNEITKKEGVFGYDIELEDLEKELLKDEKYYEINNGGITFSGGEPLLQFQKLEPLLKKLKDKNINLCVETALQVQENLIKLALEYIDEFYVDIKILDDNECSKILKGDIKQYYENLKILFEKKQNIIFRIPSTKEYTLKEKNVEKIIELLSKYKPNKVEIFKVHNLAENKYKALGKKMNYYEKIEDEELEKLLEKISELGIQGEIIKI